VDTNRTKELLHWLFRQRETFVCNKAQAEELRRVIQDVRLVLQGFEEQVRPELVNPIVRQLRMKFGDSTVCLDATTFYIARLDRIMQSKDEVVA
jgi:hypothetical protein